MYWGEVKGILANIVSQISSGSLSQDQALNLSTYGAQCLEHSQHHVQGLTAVLECEAQVLPKLLPCSDTYTHEQTYQSVCLIHKHLMNSHITCIRKAWSSFVKDQLCLGGARLFKYIAKCDKKHLNVSWDTHGEGATNPSSFLEAQKKKWATLWNDSDPNFLVELVSEFTDFREIALQNNSFSKFGIEELSKALSRYRKTSLGSDVWSPGELRGLPSQAKSWIAKSIEMPLNRACVPHQDLVSLNPLLGKKVGCRTICKTPMLYRMTIRADSEVPDWEDRNKQPYDKATKGSSALQAALWRNLMAELAHWLGEDFACVLN